MPRAVVFTTFAETAAVVATHLAQTWSVGLMTGGGARLQGGRISPERLLASFDPNTEHEPLPCQVLVCTDVLGQGHNLQRAAALVHLDRPWNPVRLHQREGRVCRPGQRATQVMLATMRPDTSWERLHAHMQRLEEALHYRTDAAHTLHTSSRDMSVPDRVVEATCAVVDTLLGRLLDACRGVRRHPRRAYWLRRIAHWRRRLSGCLPAGVIMAVEDLLAHWPGSHDVDQLLVLTEEALVDVLPPWSDADA